MIINGGGGAMLAVMSAGATVTTKLSDFVFPFPGITVSGVFNVEFAMSVTSDVVVVVSKGVTLEGDSTVATFIVRTFLVNGTTIFGAKGYF